MNVDQKLTAIRDVIQQDVGKRGLARDPRDNLLTICASDLAGACRSIAREDSPSIGIVTGFFIPDGTPPAYETDGPLGAMFMVRACRTMGIPAFIVTDWACREAFAGSGVSDCTATMLEDKNGRVEWCFPPGANDVKVRITHKVALERVGPAADGRCYTMRGRDVTKQAGAAHTMFAKPPCTRPTIGIGDGGNEIGMGRIPHETIVKNIPNGDLIHCRVPTDHLIVAGVSNWGAYALAAGVALLRGVELPAELFDPDREREILQIMVEKGPLVDGVTGKQTATVDGLSWDDYIRPLVEIGRIVKG